MKTIVTGSNGQLGKTIHEIVENSSEFIFTDINNLDTPLTPIPGNIPSPLDRPSGCVFRTRCPHASQDGKESKIKMGLVEVKPGHWLDRCGADCGNK